MARYFVVNVDNFFDSSVPSFVEFKGFDSYLSKFGLDLCAKVPVWNLQDLLNVDGSLDLRLIARPAHWTTFMIEIWQSRLECLLESEV